MWPQGRRGGEPESSSKSALGRPIVGVDGGIERHEAGRLGDAAAARQRVQPPHPGLFLGDAPVDENALDLAELGLQQ